LIEVIENNRNICILFRCRANAGLIAMAQGTANKRQSNDLCQMMERLGVEPAGGVVSRWSLSYLTALHRCQGCSSKEACREWLASVPMSVSFAPAFCPNADILFEMQVDQPPDAASAHHH
jgi:Family of unknown function (DUF6455)